MQPDASPSIAMARAAAMARSYPFETALVALKNGERVMRLGWNGKGMYLELAIAGLAALPPLAGLVAAPNQTREVRTAAHIVMRTADGSFVPWLASQTDLLASDWLVIERTKD